MYLSFGHHPRETKFRAGLKWILNPLIKSWHRAPIVLIGSLDEKFESLPRRYQAIKYDGQDNARQQKITPVDRRWHHDG